MTLQYMQAFDSQLDLFKVLLTSLFLSSARLMAFFSLAPIIGKMIPMGLVRTSVIFSFALLLVPGTAAEYMKYSAEMTWGIVIITMVKEVLIGIVLATVLGGFVWGVMGAGYFVDFQRGSSMADVFSPSADESTSYTAIFFLQGYIAYFFSIGGFLVLLDVLYDSFGIWPIFSPMPVLQLKVIDLLLSVLDSIMVLILILFGPAVIVMFLAELCLAIYSRFNQQLNVTIIAMPIKSGLLFFIIVLMLPAIFRYFEKSLDFYPMLFSEVVKVMR